MNSFGSKSTLKVGSKSYEIFRIKAVEEKGISLARLPYSLRVLLENLLRQEDGKSVTADDIEFLAKWEARERSALGTVLTAGQLADVQELERLYALPSMPAESLSQ